MTDPIKLPPGVGRLTDLGNAHRLAAASGDRLRYAPGVGWLVWPGEEGPAWKRDESAAVRAGETAVRDFLTECEGSERDARSRVAKFSFNATDAKKRLAASTAMLESAREGGDKEVVENTVNAILEESKKAAQSESDATKSKSILDAASASLTFAKRSQKVGQVRAMLDWASSFEGIRIEASALDAVPHLLASTGGTIDLRDGSTRAPAASDLISRATTVRYEPNDPSVIADALEWSAYVMDLIRDRETADWLHVWAGYCLTGSAKEEKFCILQGPPGDGKGTFVEALASALGPSLSAALNPDMFIERRGGGSKPWSLARLQGVRLARFSEADGSAKLSASLLCRVTGGESVEAEAKFQTPFDYKPEWKLTFTANDLPHANPDAKRNGLWRRLCLVPCQRPSTAEEAQDSRIKARWTDPAGGARGVLLWAVRGAERYYTLGRLPPRSAVMTQAATRYQKSSDPLGQFLEDYYTRSDPDESGQLPHVDRDDLYRNFIEWCKSNGEKYYASGAEVRERLADPPWSVDCVRNRSGCGRAYRGLRALDQKDRNDPAEEFPRNEENPDAQT
jgi:P4 family phage/plasmid primase-like protien